MLHPKFLASDRPAFWKNVSYVEHKNREGKKGEKRIAGAKWLLTLGA